MAHAQKPDFVFPRNGRVHLNRWGRQFSRLLAAEVCASAWVMLDRSCSEVAWEYWLPTPFAIFRFNSPPVRHRVPPGSERALIQFGCLCQVVGMYQSADLLVVLYMSRIQVFWNLSIHSFSIIGVQLPLVLLLDCGSRLLDIIVVRMELR